MASDLADASLSLDSVIASCTDDAGDGVSVPASPLELHFHQDVLSDVDAAKREIGYNPTRFMQMVAQYGAAETARRLLASGVGTSDGFTTLYIGGRLRLSIEARAILPWYGELFTAQEIATARRRLLEHDFEVDLYQQESGRSWPAWAVEETGQA